MCRIWIAEDGGKTFGQIRLDRRDDAAEVDISVDAAARGKGIGLFMLTAPEIAGWLGLRRLHAAVRRENAASLSLFRRAGFAEVRQDRDYLYFEKAVGHAAAG